VHSAGEGTPSSAATTSRTLISAAGRASEYPPAAPRRLRTTPPRRSAEKTCSRNCSGMSRLSAMSPRRTGFPGAVSSRRASSVSARTAYLLFMEMFTPTPLPRRQHFR